MFCFYTGMADMENKLNTAIGIGAGYGAYKTVDFVLHKGFDKILGRAFKSQEQMTYAEKDAVRQGAYLLEDMFKKEGREVKIVDLSKCNSEQLIHDEMFKAEMFYENSIKNTKNPFKKLYYILKKKYNLKDYKKGLMYLNEGKNASYSFSKHPRILINMEKFPNAVYHEMGHHIDSSNKITRALLKHLNMSGLTLKILQTSLLLGGLLLPLAKKEDSEKDNLIDKTVRFVKNNCGKIAFACGLPLLASEISANVHGVNLAKKVLNPHHLQFIKKNCFYSGINYILYALKLGGGVAIASKIKDKVVDKLNSK
jgi:hypothetical protein